MATTQRVEDTHKTAPRIRARGHLSLVEWNAEAETSESAAPGYTDPIRRTGADWLYTGGVLLLMVATALAAAASFAHL